MKSVSGIFLSALLALAFPISAFAQDPAAAPSAPSPAACTDLQADLYPGSQDGSAGEVTKLQQFLKDSGYLKNDPTGYFGPQTALAVSGFQTANGIAPLGIAGPATRAKIKSLSCGDSGSDQVYGGGSVLFSLSATCSASFFQTNPGQPLTWTLDFSGGTAPYSYTFTDAAGNTESGTSDGNSSVEITKTYSGNGTLTAKLVARSADGEKAAADCGSVDVGPDGGTALSSGSTLDAPSPADANSPWYDSFFNVGSWFGTSFFDGS